MRTRSLAEFDLSKLEDVTLDISEIQCSCQCWHLRKSRRAGGLLTFAGNYLPGSAGTNDAKLIGWRINEFCNLTSPHIDGLVIDCRLLNYEWGDDLYLSASNKPIEFPTLVIVAEAQRKAFSYAVRDDQMRSDLGSALDEMNAILRELKP